MTDTAHLTRARDQSRSRLGPVTRRQRQGIFFAAPAVLLTTVFFLLPLLGTAWTSLRRQPLYGPSKYIGFKNYMDALNDDVFWSSVWFTARFTFVTLIIGTALSFALALLVSRPKPGVGLFRTAFFLPVAMGYASAGFLWFYIFDGRVGVLNDLLVRFGITDTTVAWLSDVKTSFWAIAVVTVWKSTGFAMVIFLIGIQSIPLELFEALHMDGANPMQTVRYLILPLLRNSFALVLILGVSVGMLSFDQFFTMTKGGPSGQTMTAVYSIYANAFDYQKLGYGAALSVILLLLLALLSGAQLWFFRPKR